VGAALHDRDLVPGQAGFRDRGGGTGEPPAHDRVAGLPLPAQIGGAAAASGLERHGQDRQPPVTEVQQVAHGRLGAGRIIDADDRHVGQRRLVQDDDRATTCLDGGHGRVTVGQGQDYPGIDRGVADRPERTALGAAGVQQQAQSVDLQLARQAVEEQHGRRVGERVGQPLVDEDADGADPAPAQPRGHGVRPREAEFRGARQDSRPQRRRELVGAVVRIRHGGAGDPEVLSQCEQSQTTDRLIRRFILRHLHLSAYARFL
jgi:hypothetical protein